MLSILCNELGASQEAAPELAPQLRGARPSDSRPCARHPADSLSSRSVP